jgi:5-methyltetrahydrofolate--homocysteine methyltransferase
MAIGVSLVFLGAKKIVWLNTNTVKAKNVWHFDKQSITICFPPRNNRLMHQTIINLTSAGFVVTDGAWGTQLQQRGLKPGECPDAWNLSHPKEVEQVAKSYIDAGSRLILTNTFGASRFMLARHSLDSQVAAINRAGVEISRRAAGGRASVFASIGPSGEILMMGKVSAEQMRAAFEEQAQAIADAGADGIVIETMSDPAEAEVAAAAAHATGLPVVACMVFDSGANRDRTMMGTTPEQAAERLLAAGADCVGSNCGQGIAGFVSICRRLHAVSGSPIWIKPNAGLPKMVGATAVYSQTPEEFAAYIPELIEAGAAFIGGCCGTSPEFISAIGKRHIA